jgi:hypothetical protein
MVKKIKLSAAKQIGSIKMTMLTVLSVSYFLLWEQDYGKS